MEKLPFDVRVELEGWTLFWAFLTVGEDQSRLADLRARVTTRVRERFPEPAAIALGRAPRFYVLAYFGHAVPLSNRVLLALFIVLFAVIVYSWIKRKKYS